MSEPTYRVNLCYDPVTTYGENRWQARIRRVSDDAAVKMCFGRTMGEAFDVAQRYVRALSAPLPEDCTVWLTEDGDIFDRHEAGVLRDANA